MFSRNRKENNMLNRLCLLVALTTLVFGCKTEKPSDGGGGPIVSPTHISDDKQDTDAPAFPYFIPWWAKGR